jgi:hypothetical protein
MVLHGLNLSKYIHGAKKESKTGQVSLNRYQRPKMALINNLRADLDQNKVERPNLDSCKT